MRCKLGFPFRRTHDAALPHRARDCAEFSILFRGDPSSGTAGGKSAALDYPDAPNTGLQIDVDAFILRWDANRDGTINRDELRKSVGNRLEGLVEKLFGAFDKNQDGRLDRAELSNLARESFFWLFEAPPMPES
jgi:EF hand